MLPSTHATNRPSNDVELVAHGTLPPGLSGRLIGIGPDRVARSVHLHEGRATYVARRVELVSPVHDVVAFEGSILAFGDDDSVHEVSTDVGTLRPVEVAGHGRVLMCCPRYDRATGELHLVACDSDGAQAHVVVSPGALTRRSRYIADAGRRILGLALGRDHAVFVADGAVGVASRVGEARPTWIATDTAAARPVDAYRAGAGVVLLALTPSLERWTLHADSGTIERDVVDPAARQFARTTGVGIDGVPAYVWATGGGVIGRHDVAQCRSIHIDLTPRVAGNFVLVPDDSRPGAPDGGWFVGLIHDASPRRTELQVIDADDLARPAVATIPLPRPVPLGFRCEWVPSTGL